MNDTPHTTETVETEYKLASAAQSAYPDVDGPQGHLGLKRGHKCCGGCCDMRRAVIIVNIINLCFLLAAIMSLFALLSLDKSNLSAQEAAAISDLDGATVGVALTLSILKIIANSLGIYGALQFNVIMVGISCAVYCFDVFLALIAFNFAGLIYAVFFAYPHFFFIREVRTGIMTKENYPINEEQSCCCV